MDEGIDGGAVAGMLQAHGGLHLVKEGLDDEALGQQHLDPAGAAGSSS